MSFLRFFPQAVTGGEGARLIADDGRRLLDMSASWGAASLGHSHPALREAVHRALGSQAGASHLSTANAPAVELAEKLLSIAPERAAGRVWLGHSGSDANETVARAVILRLADRESFHSTAPIMAARRARWRSPAIPFSRASPRPRA